MYRDGDARCVGGLQDRVAEQIVLAYHFVYVEAHTQSLLPVLGGGSRACRLFRFSATRECIDELIEKAWQVVAQFRCRKVVTVMFAPDPVKPSLYDLGSLRTQEFG